MSSPSRWLLTGVAAAAFCTKGGSRVLRTRQTLSGEAKMKKVPVGRGSPEPDGCRSLSCTLLGHAPSPGGSKAKCEQQHCRSKGSPGLPCAWLHLGGLSPGGGCDASGPMEWGCPPQRGSQWLPSVCVDSVAGSTHRCHAGLSFLGSQMRKELTGLISTALSTGPKVSLRMVFMTWIQPGLLLLVSMATPRRPPGMSVAQGSSLTVVWVPASPQGWP